MTEAPDRIWANVTIRNPNAGSYASEPMHDCANTEYVRADLARPVTVAEAAKVRCQSVVDYYEQCVCDAKTDSQRNIAEFQFNAANGVLRALSQK